MRRCFLYAALVLGLTLVFGTELQSAFHFLNRSGILLFWSAMGIGALAVLIFTDAWARVYALSKIRARACKTFLAASPGRVAVVVALSAFVLAIAVAAWYAPPNTYDSLTYHMGRVAHWQQNASVEMYPTANSRQNEYPAFSEYAILQLQILLGDDRFANLVQCFAYIGCIVVASLIAQAMGLNGDGQLLAGAIAASIPMAVLQASGTQTDLVAAFWLNSAAYWILVAREFSIRRATVLIGTALALATFVKFPAALFAAPMFLWYALRVWKPTRSPKTLASVVLACAFLFLLVQGPFLARRATLSAQAFLARANDTRARTQSALMSELPLRYINRRLDAAAVMSNTARNLALHVGLPNAEWNAALTMLLRWFHRVVGIHENEDATTYPARTWSGVSFSLHEDEAGNFLHTLMGLGAVVWVLTGHTTARRRWREYIAVLAVGAVFFILVLKWQMWHSRYHSVLFVLTAPLMAAFLINTIGARASFLAAFFLLCAALPWLFWGQPRPLLGETSVLRVPRETQYFANTRYLKTPMQNTVAHIQARACHTVGLWWGGNDLEYPVFALLRARDDAARIEHVRVVNTSQILWRRRAPFRPCVIVAYNTDEPHLEWDHTRYALRAEWEPLRVYEPQP
jgi:hypothetical protein